MRLLAVLLLLATGTAWAANADLVVNMTDTPDPVIAGGIITYNASVNNNGPDPSAGSTLTFTVPPGTTFVGATPSAGTCSGVGPVICTPGPLGVGQSVTVAFRVTPTGTASLFGEQKFTHGAGPSGITHAYGLDLAPNDRWTYGAKFETGTISDPLAGDFRRHAIAGNVGYQFEKTKYAGNIEWRDEDSAASSRTTWLVRNSVGHQINPSLRLLGKLNFSASHSSQGGQFVGDYTEVVGAFAHRPVDNDRWNTLFKYTYLYNVPSPGQLSASNLALDYAQRSHVLSVDTVYDVRKWLSLGVKYGIRFGELRQSRDDGPWFSSEADLIVLRADFRFIREWDIVSEVRRLGVRAAGDSRSGLLLGVYRHIDDNVKLGAGYNFTDFSSELTDQSFRNHGWFVNLLSKF